MHDRIAGRIRFGALAGALVLLGSCATPGFDAQRGLSAAQGTMRGIAETSIPSVVTIEVVETREQQGNTQNFFEFFFGQEPEEPRLFQTEGLGSGIIIRQSGDEYYVLTNQHVIGAAEEIEVTLDDGRQFSASRVGVDERRDLALVRMEAPGESLPVARIGNSDAVRVGDFVAAIGSPLGFRSSLSLGVVSAVGRSGPRGSISEFFQTDAAINQGNSGGALVNIDGEVVGINTWISTQSGGSIGLGFAIPINTALPVVEDLISRGEARYGWLGVSLVTVDTRARDALGSDRRGVLVRSVYVGDVADRAGIRPGDFITAINGTEVLRVQDVVASIQRSEIGEALSLELVRDGQLMTTLVETAERDPDPELAARNNELWPGFSVYPITEEIRNVGELGDISGVVVADIEPRSVATRAEIAPGVVIRSVNGQEVRGVREFYRLLEPEPAILEVRFGDGDTRDVPLPR